MDGAKKAGDLRDAGWNSGAKLMKSLQRIRLSDSSKGAPWLSRGLLIDSNAVCIGFHVSVRMLRVLQREICGVRRSKTVFMCEEENGGL